MFDFRVTFLLLYMFISSFVFANPVELNQRLNQIAPNELVSFIREIVADKELNSLVEERFVFERNIDLGAYVYQLSWTPMSVKKLKKIERLFDLNFAQIEVFQTELLRAFSNTRDFQTLIQPNPLRINDREYRETLDRWIVDNLDYYNNELIEVNGTVRNIRRQIRDLPGLLDVVFSPEVKGIIRNSYATSELSIEELVILVSTIEDPREAQDFAIGHIGKAIKGMRNRPFSHRLGPAVALLIESGVFDDDGLENLLNLIRRKIQFGDLPPILEQIRNRYDEDTVLWVRGWVYENRDLLGSDLLLEIGCVKSLKDFLRS